jgi:hypothetical protein
MHAVPFFIGTKGPDATHPRSQFDILRELREFLQWRAGSSIIIAEANVKPDEDLDYVGDAGDRMHMMFDFQVNQYLFYALASEDTRPLVQSLMRARPRPQTGQRAQFLRNHDESASSGCDHGRADARGRHRVELEGYGYRGYRVGGLDYLLVRAEVDTASARRSSRSEARARGGS